MQRVSVLNGSVFIFLFARLIDPRLCMSTEGYSERSFNSFRESPPHAERPGPEAITQEMPAQELAISTGEPPIKPQRKTKQNLWGSRNQNIRRTTEFQMQEITPPNNRIVTQEKRTYSKENIWPHLQNIRRTTETKMQEITPPTQERTTQYNKIKTQEKNPYPKQNIWPHLQNIRRTTESRMQEITPPTQERTTPYNKIITEEKRTYAKQNIWPHLQNIRRTTESRMQEITPPTQERTTPYNKIKSQEKRTYPKQNIWPHLQNIRRTTESRMQEITPPTQERTTPYNKVITQEKRTYAKQNIWPHLQNVRRTTEIKMQEITPPTQERTTPYNKIITEEKRTHSKQNIWPHLQNIRRTTEVKMQEITPPTQERTTSYNKIITEEKRTPAKQNIWPHLQNIRRTTEIIQEITPPTQERTTPYNKIITEDKRTHAKKQNKWPYTQERRRTTEINMQEITPPTQDRTTPKNKIITQEKRTHAKQNIWPHTEERRRTTEIKVQEITPPTHELSTPNNKIITQEKITHAKKQNIWSHTQERRKTTEINIQEITPPTQDLTTPEFTIPKQDKITSRTETAPGDFTQRIIQPSQEGASQAQERPREGITPPSQEGASPAQERPREGITPPSHEGASPAKGKPAEEVTPPTQEGASAQEITVEGITPPSQERASPVQEKTAEGVTPLSQEGASLAQEKPAEGITPPSQEGASPAQEKQAEGVTPPSQEGASPAQEKPVEGVTPPSQEGVSPAKEKTAEGVTPPSQEGASPAQEKQAEGVTPPSQEGASPAQEKQAEGVTPPSQEGASPAQEKQAEGVTPKSQEGASPAEEKQAEGVTPPSQEGASPAQEKQAEGVTPPSQEGASPAQENQAEGVTPPSQDGASPAQEKTAEEGAQPSQEGASPAQENQAEGVTPPSQDGASSSQEKTAEEGAQPSKEGASPAQEMAAEEIAPPSQEGASSSQEKTAEEVTPPSQEGASVAQENTAEEVTPPSQEGASPELEMATEEIALSSREGASQAEEKTAEEVTPPSQEGVSPELEMTAEEISPPTQRRTKSRQEIIEEEIESPTQERTSLRQEITEEGIESPSQEITAEDITPSTHEIESPMQEKRREDIPQKIWSSRQQITAEDIESPTQEITAEGIMPLTHEITEEELMPLGPQAPDGESNTELAVDCGYPLVIPNGQVSYDNTGYLSEGTVTCDVGFSVPGEDTIFCQRNGQWSRVPCNPVDCGVPVTPDHGEMIYSGTTFNNIAMVTCYEGYDLHGVTEIRCLSSGIWDSMDYFCVPVDCGIWKNPSKTNKIIGWHTHITYTLYRGTTFGSVATAICDHGNHIYNLPGVYSESAKCLATRNWSKPNFTGCEPIVCANLQSPIKGHVIYKYSLNSMRLVSDVAIFSCDKDHAVSGFSSRTCLSTGQWSGRSPSCTLVKVDIPKCPAGRDIRGTRWNTTEPGNIATSSCKNGFYGDISRICSDKGEWLIPVYNCVSRAIEDISSSIDALKETPTSQSVDDALVKLSTATTKADTTSAMYGGEIEKVTNLLDSIVDASLSANVEVSTTQAESFLKTTSNLLDTSNTDSWQSISQDSTHDTSQTKKTTEKVLNVVTKYTEVLSKSLENNKSATEQTIKQPNIVLHVSKVSQGTADGLSFPSKADKVKHNDVKSTVHLPKKSLEGSKTFTAVVYKTLSGILSSRTTENTNTSKTEINSEVVAVTLDGWTNISNFKVNFRLGYSKTNMSSPKCMFWNESLTAWSSSGCHLTKSDKHGSSCECNHLTNFAILMSPWMQNNVDTEALDIISIVGCSVSLLSLVITVVTHIALWRYVKSDRAVILVNLSVALIISYAIFIGGVDKTENKDGCTAIAAMLQYIYLVVFFLMLAEGVELAWTMLFVFSTRSRLKWLLPTAWLLPAIIVGISLGATQLEGFGNDQSCWLSVQGGLIWAFVGPALLVMIINCVLLILVLRVMFGSKSVAQKSRSDRVKTGVRCLCVLLPLMGITWIIGIFYVNESMAWIQYVFAVCNGLQGLVIFIFHCALNQQIRMAVRKRKKKLADSYVSTTKTTSRSATIARTTVSKTDVDFRNTCATDDGTNINHRKPNEDNGSTQETFEMSDARSNGMSHSTFRSDHLLKQL